MKPISKEKLFGTDGIRGTPGIHPLTDEMLSRIGTGIARFVSLKCPSKGPCKVVIGKDTRLSGHKIENLLAKAIRKEGVSVELVGIITTPGLSYLTAHLRANMGIMISASHNKASDNGIKFFNEKGHKLSEDEEAEVENVVFDSIAGEKAAKKFKSKAKVTSLASAQDKYVNFLISSVGKLDLKGVRIALDCAFGAASPFAGKLFKKLGASVYSINDTPEGDNINVGGAINPTFLKDLVLRTKADIGVAVDGDGDRGIMVDEKGHVLDGDIILAVMTKYLMKHKKLKNNTIVSTVMSNYGLRDFLKKTGAKMICTNVGDKFVLEALLKNKLNVGGEQSGHIIFLDHLSTPDGLLTALQVLKVMKEEALSLSELSKCMTKYPQILVNIKVKERKSFDLMPKVTEKLAHFNGQLKDKGRILLRYSGTECLARVMVEGRDKALIESIAHSLADEIKNYIGV